MWSKAPLASLLLLFLSLPWNPQGVTYPSQPWSQPSQRAPTPLSSLISSPLSWDSDFKNRRRLVLVKKIIIYLEAVFWDFIDLRQKSWRKGFEGNDPGAGRLEEGRQEMNFLWSFFPRVRIDFCRLEEVRVETNDDSGWGGGIRKLHLEEEKGCFKAAVVEMVIMIKMSIMKKHDHDVVDALFPKRVTVFFCVFYLFSFWLVLL